MIQYGTYNFVHCYEWSTILVLTVLLYLGFLKFTKFYYFLDQNIYEKVNTVLNRAFNFASNEVLIGGSAIIILRTMIIGYTARVPSNNESPPSL